MNYDIVNYLSLLLSQWFFLSFKKKKKKKNYPPDDHDYVDKDHPY